MYIHVSTNFSACSQLRTRLHISKSSHKPSHNVMKPGILKVQTALLRVQSRKTCLRVSPGYPHTVHLLSTSNPLLRRCDPVGMMSFTNLQVKSLLLGLFLPSRELSTLVSFGSAYGFLYPGPSLQKNKLTLL